MCTGWRSLTVRFITRCFPFVSYFVLCPLPTSGFPRLVCMIPSLAPLLYHFTSTPTLYRYDWTLCCASKLLFPITYSALRLHCRISWLLRLILLHSSTFYLHFIIYTMLRLVFEHCHIFCKYKLSYLGFEFFFLVCRIIICICHCKLPLFCRMLRIQLHGRLLTRSIPALMLSSCPYFRLPNFGTFPAFCSCHFCSI